MHVANIRVIVQRACVRYWARACLMLLLVYALTFVLLFAFMIFLAKSSAAWSVVGVVEVAVAWERGVGVGGARSGGC